MKRVGSKAACWLVVAAVTAMFSSVSMSFAAVVNDEITSVKIKEADGTSGQNTNSGSGVKTGHLQNGAVTNAKISGTISVDKLATYSGTVIVHTGPANGIDTFNSINSAISANPVLIKVMPGIYNENIVLPATQSISIEGSGIYQTSLNGSISGTSGNSIFLKNIYIGNLSTLTPNSVTGMSTINMDNVIVSDVSCNGAISLINSTTGNVNVLSGSIHKSVVNGSISFGGIQSNNIISDSTVNAIESSTNGIELWFYAGISGPLTINNVHVNGAQYGIGVFGGGGGELTITNSDISGVKYGISSNGTVLARNSKMSGGLAVINSPTPYSTYRISNTQLTNILLEGTSPDIKLINCFDSNFNTIPNR